MNSTCELGRHSARALEPYPDYKDSGVLWLGEVPEHWAVIRTKSVLSRNESGVWGDDPIDDGVVVLRSTEQAVSGEWNITAPARRKLKPSEYGVYRLKENDLVVTKSSGSALHIGKTSIVTKDVEALDCYFSNFMQRLRVKEGILARFVWYALNGELGRSQFDYLSNTTTGLANLNGEIIGRVAFPLPPRVEQAAIFRFLDHADRRIRRYIRAKQKLIALLEEQKQAIIHQAVTGQIDVRTGRPYPAYKPSGVEWLGDVPAHWQVAALRHRYSQCLGKMLDSKRITGNHLLPYLRNVDVQWDQINTKDLPTMDIPPDEYERYTVQQGDLLVCEGGEVGRCALWSGDLTLTQCGFQKALHRLRPRNVGQDVPRFMLYALRAAVKGNAFNDGHLSTIAHLTGDKLRAHRFPFPSVAEQESLVSFLDAVLRQADRAVSRAQHQDELLREYRTRLIADVVTGKLDVREAAAGLQEVVPRAAEDDPYDGFDREAGSEGARWRHGVEEGSSLTDVSDAECAEADRGADDGGEVDGR